MNWESGGVINTRVLVNSLYLFNSEGKKRKTLLFFLVNKCEVIFFFLKQKLDIKALS